MRRYALALALILPISALAHDHRGSLTVRGERCTPDNFFFDDEPAFVAKETIDAGAARSLKASVDHAPLTVTGDSRGGYSIDVCKAARRAEDLAAIRVTFENGELRASGPSHRRWQVLYHIHAPKGADLDVEAENGPLAIRDIDGKLNVRTSNGPLSLDNVSGDVDAATTNGPISVSGGSGSVKVRASNGPLSVHLEGGAWTGGVLDASTKNGPLSLRIPRGYGSGVRVESHGRGPVSCRAEGCERKTRSWSDDEEDEPRIIQLGRGAEAIRLSTVNGPITIRDE